MFPIPAWLLLQSAPSTSSDWPLCITPHLPQVYRNDSHKGDNAPIRPAAEFHLVWRQNGQSPVTMWEPIPPVGYCALGTVVMGGVEQPLPVSSTEAASMGGSRAFVDGAGLWMAQGVVQHGRSTQQSKKQTLLAACVGVWQQGALEGLGLCTFWALRWAASRLPNEGAGHTGDKLAHASPLLLLAFRLHTLSASYHLVEV